jgi:hypothetical protein
MAMPAARWRLLSAGLAALALGFSTAAVPGTAVTRGVTRAVTAPARTGSGNSGDTGNGGNSGNSGQDAPCRAFAGARQLPGAAGVTPAAWSGGGLVVPACGPAPTAAPTAAPGPAPTAAPGAGDTAASVYAYPGALWTAGYQCVEFSERYLYDRFGVTMNVVTNGDQVVAHYAADYAGLFMVVRNGTPHRAPAAGDVLSLSTAPGFDSASGGHTAVVQSSSVNAAGNGTATVVEENAAASGVAVLPVAGWTVRYPGFPYVEWLTTAGWRP